MAAALLLIAAGCGHRIPASTPEYDGAARLVDTLSNRNADVLTFKGVGTIQKISGNQSQSFRAAWIGRHPDRLRLVVLAAGRPAVRIATDGRWVHLLDPYNRRQPLRRFAFSQSGLESILGVPVRFSDLIDLLAGRYPLRPFDSIRTVGNAPASNIVELALERKWAGTAQTLVVDSTASTVRETAFFGFGGETLYRIRYEREQAFDQRRVPTRFALESPDGRRLSFRIDRYQENVPVPADTFSLPDPNQ